MLPLPGPPPSAPSGRAVARTVRTTYACTDCGSSTPRWVGRCPSCGAWNTLVEEVVERSAPPRARGPVTPAVPITEVTVQAVAHPELAGAPGGVGQVREVAAQLVRLAKDRGIATFLVGQVTKDGVVAGPKTLEHLVDVVLSFEGDQHHALRLVRCTKNRFGPAFEVGCFEMTEGGLEPLADPSRLFLSAREAGVAGVACTVSLEGRRPLVTEVQALVSPTGLAIPRRMAQDLDQGRLAILIAVLERRARVSFGGH